MQQTFLDPIERDVCDIEGLLLLPEYVSEETERDLVEHIDRDGIWLTDFRRRVQHFGYRYNYRRRHSGTADFLGELPDWLYMLAWQMHDDGLIGHVPDQCVINEYLPGQGISAHVDCVPCFGDTVLALSLGSACVMEFRHRQRGDKIPVLLSRRSLVVMQGPSRYEWTHGIPARKRDRYGGMSWQRDRRISVTYRKMMFDN